MPCNAWRHPFLRKGYSFGTSHGRIPLVTLGMEPSVVECLQVPDIQL